MENNSKPSVVVTDLDSDGLEVTSPDSPSFDATAKKLLSAGAADAVLSLKPCLVILTNHTERMVVAFAFVWKVTYRNKPSDVTTVYSMYPDAIAGFPDIGSVSLEKRDDRPLPGAAQKLVAKEIELGPSDDEPYWQDWLRSYSEDQKRDLFEAEKIEISLDAAILSEGQLVGPDHSNLERSFTAYFESKQKFFQQVVSDLDSGQTVEEALAPLNAVARRSPTLPDRDHAAFYETLAAQDILALRRRIGDSSVRAIFSQAIRKQPFVIRRETGQ